MDITWYGQSCFRVKGKKATVVIDPFDPKATGLPLSKMSADIVLVTHQHPDHNNRAIVVKEAPFLIQAPGEYEVNGVDVVGVATYHDDEKGAKFGKNVVYNVTLDGISLVHLGDLGHLIDEETKERIGRVDILMVPVGGTYTIDAGEAVKVVDMLEPLLIIPMHYKLDHLAYDLLPVDDFMRLAGKASLRVSDKFTIQLDTFPEDQTILLMEVGGRG